MEHHKEKAHDTSHYYGSGSMKGDFFLFRDYLNKKADESIEDLYKREVDSGFPVVGRGVMDLLRVMVSVHRPQRILELGTGTGFSSILMCYYGETIKKITTVELKEKNIKRAKENIKDFGLADRIEIVHGDALKVLLEGEGLSDTYDMIFVDCAKGQYDKLWKHIRKRVRPGGVIITDDVLLCGVLGSRFLLNRRDRTIHKRMREYLFCQMNDDDFVGALFEMDDGVTILTRKMENDS